MCSRLFKRHFELPAQHEPLHNLLGTHAAVGHSHVSGAVDAATVAPVEGESARAAAAVPRRIAAHGAVYQRRANACPKRVVDAAALGSSVAADGAIEHRQRSYVVDTATLKAAHVVAAHGAVRNRENAAICYATRISLTDGNTRDDNGA